MDRSNLIGRATEIADIARNLADELARRGLPEPSFANGLPGALQSDAPDSDALAARVKLLGLLDEFKDLLTEPALLCSPELRNPSMSTLALVRVGVFENFPNEGCSVQDLARKLNLSDNVVRRLLSHAATYRVFFQARPDFFVHTASSRVLSENEGMRNWILIGLGETMPGTFRIADALAKNPNSEEPQHSGWSVQNGTDLPIFQALADMPQRASVFAKAMMWLAQLPGFSPQYLVENFPWGSGDITVVDVGGGMGHIARALAAHNPTVQCIVQDRAETIAQGENILSAELQGRVRFQAHDFFEEQPVHGADVYLLRHVLHDWSNKYARKILQALIPALKPGTKIVLNDRVVPGYGETSNLAEREARDYDMYMWGLQNAQERTRNDWDTLLRDADPRFKLTRVSKPSKSYLAIIEVVWEG
ncbi:S-adenosyl-L-methionine-dependent methyltransferase [Penicillium alfredii]|uniref:S-adenosyl-L-methionine-dependent methyltransferase n=1 Tax=Penicillium alfredii TaxID=1506179 RepID=A0A9W9JX23_9EURO|nr:S-adenosyl-L-methionine-dependent methyltransferase [Penicillium alfredii]KAJ5084748.1 S-adenosyl-L-methionine-dependent methyltransferase [Penicillium alfredii]